MEGRDRLDDLAAPSRRWPASAVPPWLAGDGDLRVLLADEDPDADAAVRTIVEAGVAVTHCRDGAEALWQAGRTEPSLVVLSVTLPVVSAADVASVLAPHLGDGRRILVGVGPGEADRAGPVLAAGADGVVSRPYRSRDIREVLRAHRSWSERRQQPAVLTLGALELDGPAFRARVGKRPLKLSLREFELLRLLMLHAGKVVSHEDIRRQLWGRRGASVGSNTIAVHVRHLRAHLRGAADLLTVRGVGYRLSMAAGDQAACPPSISGLAALAVPQTTSGPIEEDAMTAEEER